MYQLNLNNLAEVEIFAKRFAQSILPAALSQGLTIALEGELASGKTTFVAALAKALGSGDSVSSPTYVLEQLYQGKHGINIHHWDLYRLAAHSTPDELYETVRAKEVRLIEWASRSKDIYKILDLKMSFLIVSENSRSCEVRVINNNDLLPIIDQLKTI